MILTIIVDTDDKNVVVNDEREEKSIEFVDVQFDTLDLQVIIDECKKEGWK